MAIVCMPMFLVLLDVNIVHVALPHIGTGLGARPGRWSWVVDFYTVPLAVTLLAGGRLTDRFGYHIMLAAGQASFLAGSLGCALAPSWSILLASRSLQGLGAAAMLPASLAALTSLWREPAARAKALGVWSSVSAAATALGPIIGGSLIAWTDWRGIFAINIPVCGVALAALFVLESAPRIGTENRGSVRTRSLIGASGAAFLMTTVGNGVLLAATMYAQRALGLSALATGMVMLAATVPLVLLGPVTGRLMHRFSRRAVAGAGFGLGAAVLLVLSLVRPGEHVAWLALGLFGVGAGLGLLTASIVGEGMAALPGAQGLAGGINNTSRQLGTSFGVAVSGAVVAGHTRLVDGVHTIELLAAAVWALGLVVVVALFGASRSDGDADRT